LVPDPAKPLLFNLLHREKQVKQCNLRKHEDGDYAIGSNIHELGQRPIPIETCSNSRRRRRARSNTIAGAVPLVTARIGGPRRGRRYGSFSWELNSSTSLAIGA
jgi:hypothetical protein